ILPGASVDPTDARKGPRDPWRSRSPRFGSGRSATTNVAAVVLGCPTRVPTPFSPSWRDPSVSKRQQVSASGPWNTSSALSVGDHHLDPTGFRESLRGSYFYSRRKFLPSPRGRVA